MTNTINKGKIATFNTLDNASARGSLDAEIMSFLIRNNTSAIITISPKDPKRAADVTAETVVVVTVDDNDVSLSGLTTDYTFIMSLLELVVNTSPQVVTKYYRNSAAYGFVLT